MGRSGRVSRLFCFGLGYTARRLAASCAANGWSVAGTVRSPADAAILTSAGFRMHVWDGAAPLAVDAFADATHILVSIPPDGDGDPVLRSHAADLAANTASIRWLGYLSTTGVYGDRDGAWVDEDSGLAPTTERGRRRLAAERAWMRLYGDAALPLHVFRLAGIYGPGRNALADLQAGRARRIVKAGQVFSRIHVDDIVGVLAASIAAPRPGRVYNVCDDEPAPPQDVVAYAAGILGVPAPPEIPFAAAELSDMARSFYAESKRVSNVRLRDELGYRLRYPTYREGLTTLLSRS